MWGSPQLAILLALIIGLHIPVVTLFSPVASYQQHYRILVPMNDISYSKVVQRIHNIKASPTARPSHQQAYKMPSTHRGEMLKKEFCSLEINCPHVGSQKAHVVTPLSNRVHVFTFHSDQCQMLFVDNDNRPIIAMMLKAGLIEGYSGTSVCMNVFVLNNMCSTHYTCMFIIHSIADALQKGLPILTGGENPLELGLVQSSKLYRKRAVTLPLSHN